MAVVATAAPPRTERTGLVVTGFLLCVFATGTAEFLVSGLLPQLASTLDISTAQAGQAVTAYALATVLGGPVITLATARLPRKGVTLGLLATFLAGTALSAAATSYPMLMAGRVLAGLTQATLFAISLIVVTALVPPDRVGRAISWITSGFTVSILLGVPLGTLLGQQVSWRVPFYLVIGLAAAGAAILAATVPRTPPPVTGARDELRMLIRRPVLLAVATTAVGLAGVGTVYTYVVPLTTEVTGMSPEAVSAVLFAYGAGSVLGNVVVGYLTDRYPSATLRTVFVSLVAMLALIPAAVGWWLTASVAIGLLGLFATATITPLQALILRHASAAPTLSVAVNVAAFNLANALGAAIGGGLVAAGLLAHSGYFGAAITAGGLLLSLLAVPPGRSSQRTVESR